MKYVVLFVAMLLLFATTRAAAEDVNAGVRILLLTKSAGFEHSVIKQDKSGVSHVERILKPLADEMGATLTCTKDASLINAENLDNYDVVIFYTSGDLTKPGTDEHPPMAEDGVDALLKWIRAGGGFVGFHAATDSFRGGRRGPTPYTEMIGAEFETHGAQFAGTIIKTSPDHPAVASLPERWTLQDEWYLFSHLNKEAMHVLAVLEPGDERQKQEMYNIPAYPMIWCRDYGAGRVLYNGMGHREDVWEHTTFKDMVVEHIRWANGEDPLQAEPNYADVVLETVE